MKKYLIFLLHAGFWLCYFLMILVIVGIVFRNNDTDPRIEYYIKMLFFFAIVPSAISFYLFYFWLFPQHLARRKIWSGSFLALLTVLFSAFAGAGLVELLDDKPGYCANDGMTFLGEIAFISFIALASGIIAVVIRGFLTWFEEIKLKEALKEKNHDMEMTLIKSQLDPHFLFNTINNIDVLILKDAQKASDYLNQLSDIMRFMLYETKTEFILLSRELEYIHKYLTLQKIRTSNPNYVNFVQSGKADSIRIAPMLFIPFIENAIKHTHNKKTENAISISISVKKESIDFTCENKFNPNLKKSEEGNGLGNQLIARRLELIYPEKHKLEVSDTDGVYKVSLRIQHG